MKNGPTKFVQEFAAKSGFKTLAQAKLGSCEYSLFLYLFNNAALGLDQVISTERDLANILGVLPEDITQAVKTLSQRHFLKPLDTSLPANGELHPSLCLQLEFNLARWVVRPAHHAASKIITFKNHEAPAPVISSLPEKNAPTWQRIFNAFSQYQEQEDEEKILNRHAAQLLVAQHPVDQVLLMIHHFQRRIPTLNQLASSWEQFLELFEQETQQIDFDQAREKHQELDNKLRQHIKSWLAKAREVKLTEEEVEVLEMMLEHRYPRRQLFWAYQARTRYNNLHSFFAENNGLMLAVSSSGAIVKKPPTR